MRPVRPTFRVLRMMLREAPTDLWLSAESLRRVKTQVASNKRLGRYPVTSGLVLDELPHRLLERAASFLGAGKTKRHIAASRSAGRPVYEIQCMEGAAWHGALIKDDHGDPWLVHIADHDEFDNHAAEHLSISSEFQWMPTELDYKIRDSEDVLKAYRDEEIIMLITILEQLRKVAERSNPSINVVSSMITDADIHVEVTTGERYIDDMNQSAGSQAIVYVGLLSLRPTLKNEQQLGDVVHILQPSLDQGRLQVVYDLQGRRRYEITFTQAELACLISSTFIDQIAAADVFRFPPPQSALHYVDKTRLAESLVTGLAIKAVCGVWFVAQQDESSADVLPICRECERILPLYAEIARLIGSL